MGVPVTQINKIGEGSPHVVDLIRERQLRPGHQHADRLRRPRRRLRDPHRRRAPGIPCVTTMTGASAAARAISAREEHEAEVRSLQELHDRGAARGSRPRRVG